MTFTFSYRPITYINSDVLRWYLTKYGFVMSQGSNQSPPLLYIYTGNVLLVSSYPKPQRDIKDAREVATYIVDRHLALKSYIIEELRFRSTVSSALYIIADVK